MKNKLFIIAEAGVNHNGELKKAFELVDIAANAKADAVKFQTFKPGECTGKYAVKVDYLSQSSEDDESRYDITKKLALPYRDFKKIKEYATKKGILFLTTPDGFESLKYVTEVLQIPIIKISSTEVTHLAFLEAVAKKKKPIILSTGMSTLHEVGIALDVIERYCHDVTVLHCTSEYPAPEKEVNLMAMITMKNAFGVKIGYSDHTIGFEASIAAVALGATVIEKHFTIDKRLPGPDHASSLSPDELKAFVKSIKKTKVMLGDGCKRPSESEVRNITGIRRSIVAARDLKKGKKLTRTDLACKRPGDGIHPYDYEKIIGLSIKKELKTDEPIYWDYLK